MIRKITDPRVTQLLKLELEKQQKLTGYAVLLTGEDKANKPVFPLGRADLKAGLQRIWEV